MFGSPDDRGPTARTTVPVRGPLGRPLSEAGHAVLTTLQAPDPRTAETPTPQHQNPVDHSTGCRSPTIAARRSDLFEHIHGLTVVDIHIMAV